MANTIIIKNNNTGANVPAVGELVEGELAINVTDKILYSKTATTVFQVFDGVYAPVASPTFTGTVTAGTGANIRVYDNVNTDYLDITTLTSHTEINQQGGSSIVFQTGAVNRFGVGPDYTWGTVSHLIQEKAAATADINTYGQLWVKTAVPNQLWFTGDTGVDIQITDATGLAAGTVTSVSVTTANGVSGTVATATTTPAISLTLGAITPTSVGGITSENLVDKSAVEAIAGAWTFSGSNIQSAGSLRFNDGIKLAFGNSSDVQMDFNGTSTFKIDMLVGNDFSVRGGTALKTMIKAASDSDVQLYHSGTIALATKDRASTGSTSSLAVYDHNGTQRDVGFNTLPTFNMNLSDTLEARHCGHATGKDNTTTTYKLTGPTSANVDFPVGGVAHVYNLGATGNYTLEDTATCTMYFCDGAAAPVDIALNGTLAPGGMITLWRYSTTAIYITGSGFTP